MRIQRDVEYAGREPEMLILEKGDVLTVEEGEMMVIKSPDTRLYIEAKYPKENEFPTLSRP